MYYSVFFLFSLSCCITKAIEGLYNLPKHVNGVCVLWTWGFFLSSFCLFQGYRAAGWKTAGDESHAPRGSTRPLQRSVVCAKAYGAQLVWPFLPFLHVKSEKNSIYHQICLHKMGIWRLFYSMWSEINVGVDIKIGIKVWGLLFV